MHHQAQLGNAGEVERLYCWEGANIEEQDESGFTPLHWAAGTGNLNVVQKLIELGANVHAEGGKDQYTPVHVVSQSGSGPSSCAILRALLEKGGAEDLRKGDREGDTPLHCAAINGDAEILVALIKAYGSISSASSSCHASDPPPPLEVTGFPHLRNTKGRTPLHYAAGKGNTEAAQLLLLLAGASKQERDDYGVTPFHFAARCGGEAKLLELLQFPGCVDDQASSTGRAALHFAAWNGRHKAVEWLLGKGASAEAADKGGDTPLHWAARKGDSHVIRSLIEKGVNFLKQNEKEELALGLADESNHHHAGKAFVQAIRTSGKDRIKDALWTPLSTNGATLLHYFAAYGAKDDLTWIMSEMQSKTPSKFQKLDGEAINNLMDERGRNAVHWAAMKGNKDAVEILADKGADLNHSRKNGETPLYLALVNKKIEFAEELLRCKPNADDWFDRMDDWMHHHYYPNEKKEVKDLLLKSLGEFKKETGMAPLDLFSDIPPIYLALHAGRDDISEFVHKHSKGVDDAVNKRGTKTGRTSLHWATLLNQKKIVAQLCRTGTFSQSLTANVEDKWRRTALEYAKKPGLEEIEKELMERSDVKAYVDRMYQDRQVYVDAANAMLVGAALIAGVTFSGWLQPPLSYTPYYNLPHLPPPSPPDMFQSYAAVQQNLGVRWFWVFNSLSFCFAIATVIAGFMAVVPNPRLYIATSVVHLRRYLLGAAWLLGISLVFVLAAFAAAGFAVLPPLFEYQAYMMATVIVGGVPCVYLLASFPRRLGSLIQTSFSTLRSRMTCFRGGATADDRMVRASHFGMQLPGRRRGAAPPDYKVGERYDYFPWEDGLDDLLK